MELIRSSHEILTPINGDEIIKFIEIAGRTCYKSEDKITETSAKKLVKALVKSGHHSVIEHFNITVRFICDRGVTHELVRHRLAAYSQESTRYVNYKNKPMQFIIPSWWDFNPTDPAVKKTQEIWEISMRKDEETYNNLIELGWSPQRARSVLPNSLKTEIVMTANLREWRHVLDLRCGKAAHPDIVALMKPLLKEFYEKIPVIFDDLYEKHLS